MPPHPLLALLAAQQAAAAPPASALNIVFIIDESTDGRTYREDFAPLPIPNIRKLAEAGTQFDSHYVNAPVCCPSRASLWSGRLPHHITHKQKANEGLTVRGVWNNYEGLPPDYDDKIGDVLGRYGYDVHISGKTDWNTGGHSENVRLNAWTHYVRFPYNVNASGGWYDEDNCPSEGSIAKSQTVKRHKDWKTVDSTTSWIKKHSAQQLEARAKGAAAVPWFAYQGCDIVHPAYSTNEYWMGKIDVDAVTVPAWKPLVELHPCDFQASMLKKCTPSDVDAAAFYNASRRRRIRSIYYAMIAEFDAMVGEYVGAVTDAGVFNATAFVVTSDHGDMQMEHQQFYKMVQYDASTRVPLIISKPGLTKRVETSATQHVDLMPTIFDLAGVPASMRPNGTEGESLVPLLVDGHPADAHRSFVVSQFSGDNIATSWFLATDGKYKYVVWGTGKENAPQLFDLQKDPGENVNLAASQPDLVKEWDAKLQSVVNTAAVSQDVAEYNQLSFKAWTGRTKNWRKEVGTGRWSGPFNVNKTASLEAIDAWLLEPPAVKPCLPDLVYAGQTLPPGYTPVPPPAPTPAPPPAPHPPSGPCTAEAGFNCTHKSYCGREGEKGERYYYRGKESLDDCAAKCRAAGSPCTCFDHKSKECRMVNSSFTLITSSSGFDAYVKQ